MLSSAVGGRVVDCNDEFFAEASNLLNPARPVWDQDRYTDRGKWMDGWETRRRRDAGYDWCVLALGTPGRVESVTVDTAYFTGNFAEEFSLEACGVASDAELDSAEWTQIIPRTRLQGNTESELAVASPHRVSYLRLNIFPDGGVARLRLSGTPIPDIADVCPESGRVDLVSQLVGGNALDASDAHYSPPSNMNRHTEPQGMWDGWETQRRRGPGHDWALFDLGLPGQVDEFIVDTRHFKGNSPGWVSIQTGDGEDWAEVVSMVAVDAHTENHLPLEGPAHAKQVKLEIHPDGGVARFRVLGTPDSSAAGQKRIEYVNSLFGYEALKLFNTACAATDWKMAMTESRPFTTPDSVLERSLAVFDTLDESAWLEAFAGHPRIGQKGDEVANKEQAAASNAATATLSALAEVNKTYEEKFGFTYIVYATGKSADAMLAIARKRVDNGRDQELANAASQQRLITATRLRKMLCQTVRS